VPIREKLARRASKAGLSLTAEVIDGLYAYFELLRKWNRKVSLTALPVEDAGDEAIDRLLIEPVLATKYFPKIDANTLDIGSGGGSPAIPMKLANPRISLRMVESKTRKAAFLREVIRALKLDRTHVDAVRFEELLARPSLHDAMDVVTMRAVRVNGKTLSELQAFVRPSGFIFLFGTVTATAPELAGPYLSACANHSLLSQWGSCVEIFQKVGR
jgi:16S rRNA (guanine527-N7)-methyltransferase